MMSCQRALRVVQRRLYASSATAKQAPRPPPSIAPVQTGKASNGIQVAAQESQSPLARVVCAVKAGSRYEEPHQRGVAHCLRIISDQTQREARAYGMARELQQMGATISCTTTREHMIYTLEVPSGLVDAALPYLSGMVAHPSLRPWEIGDRMARLEYELLTLTEQPDQRVVESVHSAAYREAGLGRSLFAPVFQMSEFSPDLLAEYINRTYTPERIALSATGVNLADMTNAAAKFDIGKGSQSTDKAAKYYGGEMRENSEDLMAYSVLVGQGASVNSEDVWAYAVLEQLLGSGPQIRWASNTTSSMLNSTASKLTQDPFNIQAFNVNYSDSGLFGFSAVTVPENSDAVLRSAVEQLKKVAMSLPSKEALQGAKNRAKSTVAFSSECMRDVAEQRAVDLLQNGQISDVQSTLNAIENVSASAVQSAAKKVVEGKLTMASVGEIYNVPYIDQL